MKFYRLLAHKYLLAVCMLLVSCNLLALDPNDPLVPTHNNYDYYYKKMNNAENTRDQLIYAWQSVMFICLFAFEKPDFDKHSHRNKLLETSRHTVIHLACGNYVKAGLFDKNYKDMAANNLKGFCEWANIIGEVQVAESAHRGSTDAIELYAALLFYSADLTGQNMAISRLADQSTYTFYMKKFTKYLLPQYASLVRKNTIDENLSEKMLENAVDFVNATGTVR